ncbi:MAG: ABC transporter permease [Candidatus Krumholzibacteriota bacterium]|nr:ABC transporter permease [Candidatus Krumholzibacteriota bacterium]
MRKILCICGNEFKRRLKNPGAILLMMCIPLVMTLMIGLVFGRSGDNRLPVIKVLLVDLDNGIMSRFIRQGLSEDRLSEMLDIETVALAEGEDLMSEGKASAMIVIPENFTRMILDREEVSIRVVKNPSERFLPVIVREITETMAVMIGALRNVFDRPLLNAKDLFESDRWPSADRLQSLLDEARTGILLSKGYLADSLVTLAGETAGEGDSDGKSSIFNVFAFVMSGSLMMGLLFTSNIMLRDIVREKESGTLARILSSPTVAAEVVGGKVLAVYVVTFTASIILLLVSKFAFRIDLGDPLALALQLLVTMLMITGIMTFFFGMIKSARAADAIMSVLIIVMALFGGSMIPIEQMGALMGKIGRFSPVFWANDGFKMIFLTGAGTGDIALNLMIMASTGIATLLPGSYLFGRRFRNG